jgi:hypothetical protein
MLLGMAISASAAGELFRCKLLDQVSVKDDGTLTHDLTDAPNNLMVDTASGIVRISDGTGASFETTLRIVQEGSTKNDFVATGLPQYAPEEVKASGMPVTEVVDDALLAEAN